MAANQHDEQRLGLFIDFENIAIGVRDAHYRKFDINLVLERLLEKGKVLVKKAYADWSRYSDYKRAFHEAAIEMIAMPGSKLAGKNSADIKMVVDAMELSFTKAHVDTFALVSGDSDFSPLVSKLKENNKYVIGLGVKNSTSDLLLENCDEFIFYEDLVRGQQRQMPVIANVTEKVQEGFALLVDSILALQRENKEVLWGSMVKETMKRKKPSFNETYYGFRTFSHLLEDAQRRGIVVLRRDQKSGSYIVEDLGSAGSATAAATPSPAAQQTSSRTAEVTTSAVASSTNGQGETATAEAAANGTRTPRRRRSRGGRSRTRAASTGTGAYSENGSGTDEGADLDDQDDDQDDASAEASEASGSSDGVDNEPEDASAASPAPEPARHPNENEPEHAPERTFSLFSWIRRPPTE